MPRISEMGAIQPCQIPVKKPAGLIGVKFPPPGKQDVNKKINTRKEINRIEVLCLFIVIIFRDVSLNVLILI